MKYFEELKISIDIEQNESSLNRENGVVGELYKHRAARRSNKVLHLRWRKSSSQNHVKSSTKMCIRLQDLWCLISDFSHSEHFHFFITRVNETQLEHEENIASTKIMFDMNHMLEARRVDVMKDSPLCRVVRIPRKKKDKRMKIPRDLTEASLSGAGLSIIAAFSMIFLFGMELNNYLTVSTATSVIVDQSSDGDFLRIDFNISFPALSCEFASVDVKDVLGTNNNNISISAMPFPLIYLGKRQKYALPNEHLSCSAMSLPQIIKYLNRLNITKTVRKFSIDSSLRPTGAEFHSGPVANAVRHDDEVDEEYDEGSFALTEQNFDKYVHQFPLTIVNFYAPWCSWCQRLKPSWEKAAKIMKERYDPEMDGRILVTKVDCTREERGPDSISSASSISVLRSGAARCRSGLLIQQTNFEKRSAMSGGNHIQGYPSIRIFRKGTDLR
ncbi:hypothetical protein Ahy_A03g015013 [Arachis hypogaea]|uniref:Thioredoxin domain-containing protein n=1 Tax=Arachis hypogaea TaxID=3818 RepID=A0A445DZ71_ARAHY|nr:hypothetical protein Ahy_A03g015013 [Arachis hypogaea]